MVFSMRERTIFPFSAAVIFSFSSLYEKIIKKIKITQKNTSQIFVYQINNLYFCVNEKAIGSKSSPMAKKRIK